MALGVGWQILLLWEAGWYIFSSPVLLEPPVVPGSDFNVFTKFAMKLCFWFPNSGSGKNVNPVDLLERPLLVARLRVIIAGDELFSFHIACLTIDRNVVTLCVDDAFEGRVHLRG